MLSDSWVSEESSYESINSEDESEDDSESDTSSESEEEEDEEEEEEHIPWSTMRCFADRGWNSVPMYQTTLKMDNFDQGMGRIISNVEGAIDMTFDSEKRSLFVLYSNSFNIYRHEAPTFGISFKPNSVTSICVDSRRDRIFVGGWSVGYLDYKGEEGWKFPDLASVGQVTSLALDDDHDRLLLCSSHGVTVLDLAGMSTLFSLSLPTNITFESRIPSSVLVDHDLDRYLVHYSTTKVNYEFAIYSRRDGAFLHELKLPHRLYGTHVYVLAGGGRELGPRFAIANFGRIIEATNGRYLRQWSSRGVEQRLLLVEHANTDASAPIAFDRKTGYIAYNHNQLCVVKGNAWIEDTMIWQPSMHRYSSPDVRRIVTVIMQIQRLEEHPKCVVTLLPNELWFTIFSLM